ncbi:N-acetylmuramoyl-L-alanine amidase [Brachybacterium hainanense]|uniref:N-acetylmuramoyl-L-alanine amidase n=1 Tax=Brachybacterium hainanense TaxID=1541174 RepID=A0ABV6R7Z5_9MICO
MPPSSSAPRRPAASRPLSRRSLLAASAAVPAVLAASTVPALADPVVLGGSTSTQDVPLATADQRAVDGAVIRVLPRTPATMVGLTWDASEAGSAQVAARVRGRGEDGRFGAWVDLEIAIDPETGDEAPGTEVAWLGPVTELEIRAEFDGADATAAMTAHVLTTSAGGADGSLRADARSAMTRSGGGTATTLAASSPETPLLMAAPAIVRRATWGADESLCRETTGHDLLRSIVVHHTAGTNMYTRSQSPQILRGILEYHTRTLGWADIGYNVLIDKYGRIFEGRAGGLHRVVEGAHARGYNTSTAGISLLGDFSSAAVPAAAISAIAKVAGWKLGGSFVTSATSSTTVRVTADGVVHPKGTIISLPRIFGHRDVNYTDCPGDRLYAQLDAIRRGAQEAMSSGWMVHRDAYYAAGGAPKLGMVFQIAHWEDGYWVTRLTKGLVLSQGDAAGTGYATPFAREWTPAWGRPTGSAVTQATGRITQAFAAGTASRPSATGAVTFTRT